MTSPESPTPTPERPPAHRVLLVVLWLVALAGYRAAATQLASSPLYGRDNVCFRADTKRALGDLVGTRLQDHNHTTGHPNFVIWHQPLGSAVREWYRAVDAELKPAEARRQAAPWVTAAAGASAVVLMFSLLRQWLPSRRSLLFALIYGASASTVFYAAVPETYIFSGLGLTAIAWAAGRRGRGANAAWLWSVVYAASNLTINFVPAVLWAGVRFPPRRAWRQAALSLLASGLLLMALSLLQALIYPKTTLFFLPSSVGREAGWLSWEVFTSPWPTLRTIAQHLWFTNIISPEPRLVEVLGLPMASVESGDWGSIRPAAPLLCLWVVVLGGALGGLCQRRAWSPPLLAAASCLGFYAAFFSVFGHDRMLYTALWTPMTILVAAIGTEYFLARHARWARSWDALLVILVLGMGWHHWHFLGKLAALVTA